MASDMAAAQDLTSQINDLNEKIRLCNNLFGCINDILAAIEENLIKEYNTINFDVIYKNTIYLINIHMEWIV